ESDWNAVKCKDPSRLSTPRGMPVAGGTVSCYYQNTKEIYDAVKQSNRSNRPGPPYAQNVRALGRDDSSSSGGYRQSGRAPAQGHGRNRGGGADRSRDRVQTL